MRLRSKSRPTPSSCSGFASTSSLCQLGHKRSFWERESSMARICLKSSKVPHNSFSAIRNLGRTLKSSGKIRRNPKLTKMSPRTFLTLGTSGWRVIRTIRGATFGSIVRSLIKERRLGSLFHWLRMLGLLCLMSRAPIMMLERTRRSFALMNSHQNR